MSPKTMRVLEVNVCVLLVAFSVIHAKTGSVTPGVVATGTPECVPFWDHTESEKDPNSKIFLDLMKKRFELSMKYLLTSKQYGSQYVERPGMAKYLDEASSRQWEEGMDLLKKFLQRGGQSGGKHLDHFKQAFGVTGIPQLSLDSVVDGDQYVATLADLLNDSKDVYKSMNHLHHLGGKICPHGGDAEIAHYFDGKLEKEAELTRELTGHHVTLQKMSGLGVAVNMFDSNL